MEKEKVIERIKQIKARLLSYPMDAIADIHFILEFSSNLIDETEKEVKENQRLKTQLDKEIHINRKMKNAISLASYYLASPNDLSDDVPNEELAFQELRQTLNEINNEE